MIREFEDTIKRHRMLEPGDRVLAAVSGGIDSSVMLHVLDRLKERLGISLSICHLNHGLRGAESERDARFVKETAKRLGLGFIGGRLKAGELDVKGLSKQEAARARRYDFFEAAAKRRGFTKVALGHTLDDQAETVLMRFIKGSSLTGLAGIPPVRGIYVRPLIETRRDDIERYARQHGVGYVVDSTNLATDYLRNSLRLKLLPLLGSEYNPNIVETLARTARVLSRDEEYLRDEAGRAYKDALVRSAKGEAVFSVSRIRSMHPSLAARVFIEAYGRLFSDTLASRHIDAFMDLIRGRRPNAAIDLPGGVSVIRAYDVVSVTNAPPSARVFFGVALNVPGDTAIEAAGCVLKASFVRRPPKMDEASAEEAYFDYEALRGKPVTVRQFKPGDRVALPGLKGSKKIKDVFIECKVPRGERLKTPLLVAGEDVIWVAGLRASGLYRAGETAKRILKVKFIRGSGG